MRWFRWFGSIVVLATLLLGGRDGAAAQSPERRWLAEPLLLAEGKTRAIVDLAVIDATHVWATQDRQISFFDGARWSAQFKAPDTLTNIEMFSPTKGWAFSPASYGNPQRSDRFYRFDGSGWHSAPTAQSLIRWMAAAGDGSLLAIGWNGISGSNGRETLERFDGSAWHTITPFDRARMQIQVAPDGSTWVWGNSVGGISMFDAPQPFVLRYENGALDSINVPPSGPSGPEVVNKEGLTSVQMLSRNEGWAHLVTVRGEHKVYHYLNGVWSERSLPVPAENGGAPYTRLHFVAGTPGEAIAMMGWGNSYDQCGPLTVLRYHGGAWSITGAANALMQGEFVPNTSTGWFTSAACGSNQPPQRYRLENGVFTLDSAGSDLVPTEYHLLSEDVQWADTSSSGTILRYGTGTMPTAPVAAAANARYFPETGHNLSGPFRSFYESNGLNFGDPGISAAESLALFGLPLTEPFTELNPDTGESLLVQYFERVRMEYHPNNPAPYKVLLGRLGAVRYIQRFGGSIEPGAADAPLGEGCERVPETNHDLCPPFRAYWKSVGNVQIFGLPIAKASPQVSDTDGASYLTLWTERERLEHHPELAGTRYEILLGLLAKEDLRMRGYLE